MTFNVGDIVMVDHPVYKDWSGEAEVVSVSKDSANIRPLFGVNKGIRGEVINDYLSPLAVDPLDAFKRELEALRKKGWTLEVRATEPPTVSKPFSL